MKINTLKDCYKIFSTNNKNVFGIGVTAFMRIIPAFFLKENFGIICYKDSLDLDILRKYTDIFSLQKIIGKEKLKKLNTSNILIHPETIKYCKKHPGSYISVYKNNEDIEKAAKKNGCKILDNTPKKRDVFENKKHFRDILHHIGIHPIPGENVTLTALLRKDYHDFQKTYGNRLVAQLPDITNGGGLGTFFINGEKDFVAFKKSIQKGIHRDTKISSVNITAFIDGISASIIGCTTKHGTFSSSIQTQLIDIPEVVNLQKGSGLFCGHDRSYKHFPPAIQKQAADMIKKLGAYMYAKGYKGIFGLDLIIDEAQKKVHIIECNPRYTGAFPMISLLDIKQGIIPMDVFHILEHMNISYTMDFASLDRKYKYRKQGSHIILCNKQRHEAICKKDLTPGVYTYKKDVLTYKRPGLGYSDIKSTNEFIIIDGNPRKGEKIRVFSELSRFCHLLFPDSIAISPNRLNASAKNIINHIYHEFIG